MDDLTGRATRSIPSSVAEALAVILMEAESARRAAKTSAHLKAGNHEEFLFLVLTKSSQKVSPLAKAGLGRRSISSVRNYCRTGYKIMKGGQHDQR